MQPKNTEVVVSDEGTMDWFACDWHVVRIPAQLQAMCRFARLCIVFYLSISYVHVMRMQAAAAVTCQQALTVLTARQSCAGLFAAKAGLRRWVTRHCPLPLIVPKLRNERQRPMLRHGHASKTLWLWSRPNGPGWLHRLQWQSRTWPWSRPQMIRCASLIEP